MPGPNFASILSASPTEVLRPPPLPIGTYLCTVGPYEIGQSANTKTDYIEFELRPISAMEDVDQTILEESGGLDSRTLKHRFYITEDAVFLLDQFHVDCGLDIAADGLDRAARNDEILNARVLAEVKHETARNDSGRIYPRINRTAVAA